MNGSESESGLGSIRKYNLEQCACQEGVARVAKVTVAETLPTSCYLCRIVARINNIRN